VIAVLLVVVGPAGAQQLQLQPLVLPLGRGGNSAVGRGRAGRSSTTAVAASGFTFGAW